MAAATARSPSPGPGARPGCAVRRSADSSPAASPCDLAALRSSAVCRNASPRASWCAEKENSGQRDAAARAAAAPKPARPAAGAAKNFMAPTISAASKASPRKKVLGERNEQQQQQQLYPVASSPVKPVASEAGAPRRLRLSFDGAPNTAPPAASTPVTAAAGSRHSFGGEEERRVENPPCKNHHHATAFDDAAPAEADQGAAPYDPRTNYLSPRPRFLHYKPNPRIDLYRQGSSGGVRRLEDGFASESSEETVTTTTTASEEEVDLVDEEEQAHLSSELGDGAAVPAADACALPLEPAPGSPRARVLTPEAATRSPCARVQTPEPEPTASSERARRPKKRSSLRFLVAPLALVVFMAAALICVPPPPVDSPVMPRTALSKVSDFLSVQELHPVELAAWLKQWSSSSLNLVTSYWESLVWAQEQEFFGPHFAANLSAAAASADEGVDLYGNFVETRPVLMEDIGVGSFVQDSKIQEAVSASDSELISEISDVEQEAIPDEGDVIDDGVLAEELNVEMPEEDAEMSQEVSGSNGEEMASFSHDLEPSQPAGEAEPQENIETSTSSLEQDVQTDDSEGDHADGEERPEADHGMKSELGMWPSYLDKISKPAAAGAALAAVIVPAALAFLLMRKKQAQAGANAAAEAPAEQAEPVVEKTLSGSGSSEGHLRVKGSQLQTPPVADETERFGGGSGASMYSSSLSSGYGRRKSSAKEDESLSLDPVSRRDSAAQPTSSYGSFTTYEKIPAKKVYN
uniref:Uncharacterized protein n=1 Tax=Oryza glumipatula TaxID=40148 RepID=A0A0D9ZBF2_9ORYZ